MGSDTRRILQQLQPALVLSGDMHESCYYQHSFGGGGDAADVPVEAPEWTVTTFNPLQGTQFPGVGILAMYGQNLAGNLSSHSQSHVRNGRISFHHCFLCPLLYSAVGHGVAAAVLLFAFVLRRLKGFSVTVQRGQMGDCCCC